MTGNGPAPVAGAPPNARIVLGSLILVAAVANLNLSVANVALPSIGKTFDSSQTMLDLIAVGYSLGLAASVLWFGALGDRYGRKLMIVLGMTLAVPASLVAGLAPTDSVLRVARIVGGVSAGSPSSVSPSSRCSASGAKARPTGSWPSRSCSWASAWAWPGHRRRTR